MAKARNQEENTEELEVEIRYTINHYLKKSKHPEAIQRMMRDLFK